MQQSVPVVYNHHSHDLFSKDGGKWSEFTSEVEVEVEEGGSKDGINHSINEGFNVVSNSNRANIYDKDGCSFSGENRGFDGNGSRSLTSRLGAGGFNSESRVSDSLMDGQVLKTGGSTLELGCDNNSQLLGGSVICGTSFGDSEARCCNNRFEALQNKATRQKVWKAAQALGVEGACNDLVYNDLIEKCEVRDHEAKVRRENEMGAS